MTAAPPPVGLKVLVFLYQRDPARVLLFRRRGDRSNGWHPVTGHAEPEDATPRDAALREVEEETGLTLGAVEELSEVFRFTQVREGQERTYEEHAFAADVTGRGPVRLSAEHVSFGWFSLKNAPDALVYPTQRRILSDFLERLRSRFAPPPAPAPGPEPSPDAPPQAGASNAA